MTAPAMKWYFCINEDGLERYAGMLRVAVASARARTSLSPQLIYDGGEHPLIGQFASAGVSVHHARTPLLPAILARPEGPGYRHRIAAGAYLRMEIARIEQADEFVLYTDCDVMFQDEVELSGLRPATLAAAPEFGPDEWSYFNSGSMLLNVACLKQSYDGLIALSAARLGATAYDQAVYNEFFAGRWERLPPAFNWKPYWGRNDAAPIIHFHGPKLPALAALIDGAEGEVVHDVWRELFERAPDAYRHYYALAKGWLG